MVVIATTSKRSTELQDAGFRSTALDIIKNQKSQLKLHFRFCVVVLLILGVLVTVPTEFFVEDSIVSQRLAHSTKSSLPVDYLSAVQLGQNVLNESLEEPFIQDVLVLAEELLLLVRLPDRKFRLSGKSKLTCRSQRNTSVAARGLEYLRGRAAVRCGLLSDLVGIGETIDVVLQDSQTGAQIFPRKGTKGKKWGSALVFELWATEKDVVLFAKGINRRRGTNVNAGDLRCVFDGGIYETRVTVSAQEVFRCEHPPPGDARQTVAGRPATLRWQGKLVETVAYYEETSGPEAAAEGRKMCACTVIYDVSKFLREWVMYHAHVGVEEFVFYDNNSDDELDATLDFLRMKKSLEVRKRAWPWPKTQEAAFSHCALSARHVCNWTLFTDVDEFLFPASWLPPPQTAAATSPPLHRMLANLTSSRRTPPTATPESSPLLYHTADVLASRLSPPPRRRQTTRRGKNEPSRTVGQISFNCHDFGPSGLTQHPLQGVTQGYTCRTRQGERHKSMVKLDAITDELTNVVHRFELGPGYETLRLEEASAVVKHYKFQAWSEFRRKFRRRVSAYVTDWKESRNLQSRDRAPGLGSSEAKPPAWESRFCEVRDTALREYTRHVFAVNVSGEQRLAWEL